MDAHLSLPFPQRQASGLRSALFAALFWAFTYAVLTARAELLFGDGYDLIGARRIVATSTGALIYWLVLKWIERVARGASSSGVAPIIATILPATVVVLAARLVYDQFYGAPSPLQENLRWVMIWAGYFGMWVSAALAFRMQQKRRTEVRSEPRAAAAERLDENRPTSPLDFDRLVEESARHMASVPVATRQALAQQLLDRAGYHAAESDWRNVGPPAEPSAPPPGERSGRTATKSAGGKDES